MCILVLRLGRSRSAFPWLIDMFLYAIVFTMTSK